MRCACVGRWVAVLVLSALPHAGVAAGVVGDGTPESCTGAELAAALVGGGTVTFDCGDATVVIPANAASISGGAVAVVDGGGRVVLDGENARQLFYVFDAISQLTLRDVELRRGSSSSGGLLRNKGTLRLERVVVRDGTATGLGGGGIYNQATLEVYDSRFVSNAASGAGAAILHGAGTATIERSLFEENSALFGAIYVTNGSVSVVNSTFTGNDVDCGGGAYVRGGELALQNTTIDSNFADLGGAIFMEAGTATVRSSVLSRSRTRDGSDVSFDCDGRANAVQSLGSNVVSDASCALGGATDANSTDPLLGALADNGGPTQTIAPLAGSPLVDAGDGPSCPALDQRGAARPQDGDANSVATCDIGAVEVPEASPALSGALALLTAAGMRRRSGRRGDTFRARGALPLRREQRDGALPV